FTPRLAVAVPARLDQAELVQPPPIGDRAGRAHQLQRGGDPVPLADAGDDRLPRVPRLGADLSLVVARWHHAAVLAQQVDAGGFAEAVAVHVAGQLVDAHVERELVVVRVDRLRDRVAQ